MTRPGLAISVLLVCALAPLFPPNAAADWPRWRGLDGAGAIRQTPPVDPSGGAGLEILWTQPLGGGFAGVTVADDRVYTMDRQGDTPDVTERVLCFDAKDGTALWEHSYPANYDGLEYDSGPRSSVTLHGGFAYAIGADGAFHCLDAATGRVIWRHDTVGALGAKRPKWGFAASPVIWKDSVIVHLGIPDGGGLVAFGLRDGKEHWRGSDDPAGYATPVFAIDENGRDLMISWTPKHVLALDPDDGSLIWAFPHEITYGVSIATPLVRDGLVLISSYWHGARTLRLTDGSLVWEDAMLRGLMSCPLFHQGVGYLLERESGLVAFGFTTGEKRWDDAHLLTPVDRNPQASIVQLGQDGRDILALNANGELIHATLGEDGLTEHWREQLTGKTWAHPAYSARRVYARDDRRLVAAQLPVLKE